MYIGLASSSRSIYATTPRCGTSVAFTESPSPGQGYLTKTIKYLYLTKIVKLVVPYDYETHHERPFRRHGDD
ncbi:MAG: hypothetical protein VB143_05645 [Burkholderia sp.]